MNIVAITRRTMDSSDLFPRSQTVRLFLPESGMLGEGYMNTAEDQILDFVKVLADHPQDVTVKQIDGDPIVFEITISAKDFIEVSSKQKVIRAIAGYSSELTYNQFVLKILEKWSWWTDRVSFTGRVVGPCFFFVPETNHREGKLLPADLLPLQYLSGPLLGILVDVSQSPWLDLTQARWSGTHDCWRDGQFLFRNWGDGSRLDADGGSMFSADWQQIGLS
jgi:predicted RNA-binding protein YlqC (UPF0109 family)